MVWVPLVPSMMVKSEAAKPATGRLAGVSIAAGRGGHDGGGEAVAEVDGDQIVGIDHGGARAGVAAAQVVVDQLGAVERRAG